MDEGQPKPHRRWADVFDEWLTGKRSFADWLLKSLAQPDAFPAYLNALFSLALALFAAFAWIDSKDTARQTQEQLDLLRGQQRAWLYVKKVELAGWRVDPDYSEALYVFSRWTISNAGRSPGEHTYLHTRIDWPDRKPFPQGDDNEDCARINTPIGGKTIFPNAKTPFQGEIFVYTKKDIEAALRAKKRVSLTACITYFSPTDNIRHTTRAGYILLLKNYDAEAPFEVNNIDLYESSSVGQYAD